VKIGGGGGFTPGIVFSETTKGVAYARTDIGGLYRLNSDDSWTPLLDFADGSTWYGHTGPSDDYCLIIQELLGCQCTRK
jgi:hypothetical protein